MKLQRYTLPRSRFNSISPNSYGTFFKADEAESLIAEKDQRIKELEAELKLIHQCNLEEQAERKEWRRDAQELFAENQRLREVLEHIG